MYQPTFVGGSAYTKPNMKFVGSTISEPQKIYTCSMCFKNYKYDQSLKMHQRYQCGKEPQFKCNVCSYRTFLKGNMSKHCVRMHGVEYYNNENNLNKF